MSCVTCNMSLVTSHVTCHVCSVSIYSFLLSNYSMEGLLSTGPTISSFLTSYVCSSPLLAKQLFWFWGDVWRTYNTIITKGYIIFNYYKVKTKQKLNISYKWQVTGDTWQVKHDTWHMTHKTWHIVWDEHSLKISAS